MATVTNMEVEHWSFDFDKAFFVILRKFEIRP